MKNCPKGIRTHLQSIDLAALIGEPVRTESCSALFFETYYTMLPHRCQPNLQTNRKFSPWEGLVFVHPNEIRYTSISLPKIQRIQNPLLDQSCSDVRNHPGIQLQLLVIASGASCCSETRCGRS